VTGYRVAIVGATGVVGETLARVLHERAFPMSALRAFATQRSAGSIVRSGAHEAVVEAIDASAADLTAFDGVDLAFFAVGDQVSAAYGRALAQRGTLVIDKSSAYRLEPDVPLVVPEVNGIACAGKKLIANPNCAAIPLALVLGVVDREFGLAWASATTYQSVSGAGRDAVEELEAQLDGDDRVRALPHRIAGNVIPQIGAFGSDGYTGEEKKVGDELRKILNRPDLPISATTVRVPVSVGHSESLSFGTIRPATRDQIRDALKTGPGLTYSEGAGYATPLDVAGTDRVDVGRLRADLAHSDGWLVWVVSDNLRKGAATNAVQIAEIALETARVPA
jgi:aspartate-semialdehyde dehydrogenase